MMSTARRAAIVLALSIAVAGSGAFGAFAETTPSPATDAGVSKKPTKAELGAMLKKCSEEADSKGLTVQKGKGEARKAYRRACMMKNGVAPREK